MKESLNNRDICIQNASAAAFAQFKKKETFNKKITGDSRYN